MSEDTENYPEYEINSFMDFGNIPEDKLDHCLEDFKIFIKQALGMKRKIESIADIAKEMGLVTEEEYPEGSDAISFHKFIWIDDGKHEITKTFHFTEGDEDDPFLSIKEDDEGRLTLSGTSIDDNVGNV